jgi:adenylate cyclase
MSPPWRRRIFLRESAWAVAVFTGLIYAYFLTANWGIQDYLAEGPVKDYLQNPAVHLQHLVAGLLFGLTLTTVNWLTEGPWLRGRSLGVVVLARTVLYFLGIGMVFLAVAGLFLLTSILSWEGLRALVGAFSPRYIISIGAWLALVAIGINVLLEVRRLVGGGNLLRLLTGHYRRPRDEDRVFLFMDLVASTATAEQLGHKRYSRFIQECFRDLTVVALEYGGMIYQYVGDEVVMSWHAESPGARCRSIQAFFAYEGILEARAAAYEDRYGVIPRFRGGIDVGSVTATEVGEVKRAIAYHGDALNTAARLLELCKEREDRLLVSNRIGDEALKEAGARWSWQDEVLMRGKQEATVVLSLEPESAS